MKKNTIKLNENTLRKIVAESVKKTLNEYEGDPEYASRYEYNLMNYDPYDYGQGRERNIFLDTDEEEKEKAWRRKLPSDINNLYNNIKGTLQILGNYYYRPYEGNWGDLSNERISDIMFDVKNLLEEALKKLREI